MSVEEKQKELSPSEMIKEPYTNSDKLKTKRWGLTLTHKEYGDLLTRLIYDELSRKQLTRGIYDLYLTNDPDFLVCLGKIKERFQKKSTRNRKTRKMIARANAADNLLAEQTGIKKKDIDDLYTILEKELPFSLTDEDEKEEKIK